MEESEAEEQFVAEEIRGERERNGEVQYLIKWKDYSSDENTWESEKLLVCSELIAKYKESQKMGTEAVPRKESVTSCMTRGFQRGLEAERILGVTKVEGNLIYLMKWKGLDECDLVTSDEAKEKCPQLVLNFLERHIILYESNHKDSDDEEN